MMKDLIFNEDQRVISLTLEDLKNTSDYRGIKKHEISHYELFGQIMNDLSSRGYNATLDELYVSKTGVIYPTAKEVTDRGYLTSINDIRGVIVQNCIGKINITGEGLSNKESNQQIAIGYNKQGLSMSMGQGISICANMNIFGGQSMSNYGTSKVPFMRMIEIMASWIQNMRKLRTRDMAILDVLKSVEIEPVTEVDQVIGNLHRLCEMNVKNSKIVAPLTHSRIHDVQRGMMDFEGGLATAYDFYQASTEVSTHQSVLENRMANTAELGNYFAKRYGAVMDVEFDEVVETSIV